MGGIRPIAVGNVLRRLVEKISASLATSEASELLLPFQLGVGVRKGAEAAIHAVRRYIIDHEGSGNAVLKIDFRNAFNTLRREVLLEKVRQNFLWLFPFVYQGYASMTFLVWGSEVIMSEEGVQQGDPLWPLLFGLGINDLVRLLSSSRSLGLEVNSGKYELLVLSGETTIPDSTHSRFLSIDPGAQNVPFRQGQLLGSAIHTDAVPSLITEKVAELKHRCVRLTEVDRHEALFLLRFCLSTPKIVYLLRSAPCFSCPEVSQFDKVLKSSLSNLLNMRLDDFS